MKMRDKIEPRGLSVSQASAYWGVSPGTFKKLGTARASASAAQVAGLDRNIFDKFELDRAMDAARKPSEVAA